jgi:hypothetical protein
MAVRVADRELLIRSSRAKEIREETTIRISRAKAFKREATREAATRAERDLVRWPEIRAVEMVVVADTDHLCVSYLLQSLLINMFVYYSP